MRPLFLIGCLFFIALFFLCFDCLLTLGSFGFYCVPFRFNSTIAAKFLSFKEPYSFFTSPIDFIILWLLRAFILIYGSLHVLRRKFRRYNVYFVGLIIFNWGFSLSKLLAFSEIEEQLEFVGIYFSLLWNILAFILVWLIWRLVFISNLIEILISRIYSTSNEDSEQLFMDEIENDDDEDKNRQTAFGHTAKILYYCKAQWRWYTLGFFFLVIYAGSRILLPHFTGIVISRIMTHTEDIWRLLDAIKFMGILTIIRTISGGINAGCFEYATTAMNRKMRSDLFRSILYQEIAFFDEVKTGELISRITADCQTMSSLVSANFNVLLRNIVMLVGALGFMFFLSWRLTLVSFIALPIVLFILRAYGFYYEKLCEHSQNSVAEANQVVDETISTMRTVRSFANEKNECTRFDGFLKKTLKINQKKSVAYLSYAWLNECSDSIILVAVLFYGGFLVLNGKLDMASFASFLFYQMLLGENLYFIGSVFSSLMEGVGSSRKVFEYMNREPRIEHSGNLIAQIEGKIEFQDVSFAYPVRFNVDVLQNVSFEINPGETVALVGPSGAGKSTIIQLLEHFYQPKGGRILLDSVPIEYYDHVFYHQIVSLVSQEPILYEGSVRYNILYGCKDDVSEESMIQAAKLANVHDFVMEMKHGYGTNCGEKGLQMSGGQKQRIAIARALVRNPKVLLLDEATSALDAENESKIQEALQKCSVGRTTIIIAHRLSTVERADRIFVVDKGRLIQVGNHRSLLEDIDGLYYSLVNKQILTNTENNESI